MLENLMKEKLDTELLERLDGAPNWKIKRCIHEGYISEPQFSSKEQPEANFCCCRSGTGAH
jgi:hypothetical protein